MSANKGKGEPSRPKEFGKRNAHLSTPPGLTPPDEAKAQRRKSGLAIALVAMGAGAVYLYSTRSPTECEKRRAAGSTETCRTSSSSGHSSWFIGSTSSSSSPSSSVASKSTSTSHVAASRGGFGGSGGHFSGGGS